MAAGKKDGGSGCGAVALVAILVVGTATWLLTSNIFSPGTLWNFGPGQYLANIKNFHHDFYMTVTQGIDVYEKIIPIRDVSSGRVKPLMQTQKNKVFKLKGYRSIGHVTWIAVKSIHDGELIYAYVLVPKDVSRTIRTFSRSVPTLRDDDENDIIQNEYFMETPSKKFRDVGEKLHGEFIDIAFSKFEIEKATGNLKLQEIIESSKYKLIDFTHESFGWKFYHSAGENSSFYCSSKEYEKLMDLKEDMLGEDNFEKNLFH